MSDYLPPIVTKLDGDIEPLARKLAEAEKLVDEYGKSVEKTTKAHGEAAGEAGGKGLTEKLEEEVGRPTVADKPLSKLADKVEAKFRELGEKSGRDMADAIEQETKSLESRLTQLANDFVSSGDFDLFKQYKQAQGDLGLLNKVRTEFDAIKGEAEKVGKDVEQALIPGDSGNSRGGFMRFVTQFAGELTTGVKAGLSAGLDSVGELASDHKVGFAIAAAITVASPAIGAALDAALLLGVGGGGLVAGIVGAFHDTRVKDAWSATISNIKSEFVDASTPLVKPLVDGADKFGAAFDRYLPTIERDMDQLAPVVDHLIDGTIGFIDKMGPGLQQAFEASLPLLDEVAADLPVMGEYMGEFFQSVADGGPGAVQFFHDLTNFIGFTIGQLGNLIEFLSNTYGVFEGLAKMASGDMSGALDVAKNFGEGTKSSFQKTAEGATAAQQAIDKTTKSLSDFISEALRMQDTDLALQKGLFDVADAFKQNGASLDISTQKGLANREALQHQIETIAQWRQQQLDAGKAPPYVNAEVDKQITAMYNAATAHGADTRALQSLIGQWRTMLDLPSNKSFTTTFTTVQIAERIDRGSIASPRGNMRVERFGGIARHAQHAETGLITRAGIYPGHGDGTVVMAEQPTREEGFMPREGISAPEAYALLSTMASWRGWAVDTSGGGSQATYATAGGGRAGGYDGPPLQLQLVVDGRTFFEQVVLPYSQQFERDNGYSGVA